VFLGEIYYSRTEGAMASKKCVSCDGTGVCSGCGGKLEKANSCPCNFGKCSRCKGSGKEPN